MSVITALYKSTIGKKIVMGVSGLFLCVYLVVHVAGNFLLFKGDGGAAFNAYAEILPGLLVIRIIEIVLIAIFISHILFGTLTWLANKRARPQPYLVNKSGENSTLFSRTMFLTGSVIFIFLVVHMGTFWYPTRIGGAEPVPMYGVVAATFSHPLYSAFYVAALVLLSFHLRHGFQSAMQTFGLRNRKFTSLIEFVGILFWLIIPLGFASMPVYFFYLSCSH